jgi:hypothetical protein
MINQIFISFDADSAGCKVGRAILSDDPEQLKEISERIQLGNEIIGEWAKQYGGIVYSSGGDQGLYLISADSLESIEEIRKDYQLATGLTVSMGIGDTLSESGKALLVAKFRGKDMALKYEPSMEEEIKKTQEKSESGTASPEEQKLSDAYLKPEESAEEECPYCKEHKEYSECPYCKELDNRKEQDHDLDDCPYCKEQYDHNHVDDDCPYCQEMKDIENINEVEETDGPSVQSFTTQDSDEQIDPSVQPPVLPNPSKEESIPMELGTSTDSYANNEPAPIPSNVNTEEKDPIEVIEADTESEDGISRVPGFEENTPGDMSVGSGPQPNVDSAPIESGNKTNLLQLMGSTLEEFKNSKAVLEQIKSQYPELYQSYVNMLKFMIETAKFLGFNKPLGQEQAGLMPEKEWDPFPTHPDHMTNVQQDKQVINEDDQVVNEDRTVGPGLGKLPTSQTTEHVARTPLLPGSINAKGQKKVVDPVTGKVRWIDMKEGKVQSPTGVPVKPSKG